MKNKDAIKLILACNQSEEKRIARIIELNKEIEAQHARGVCDHEKQDEEIWRLHQESAIYRNIQSAATSLLELRLQNNPLGLN